MKLSKAQQAVVDKMREGWTMYSGHIQLHGDTECYSPITNRLFFKMIRSGIIEIKSQYPTIYRLTEQYKTANNENSNTRDTKE